MSDPKETAGWLIFESDESKAAEYADFDEQIEMKPEDQSEHHEYVKRVGEEFGFPLSPWTPTIPSHTKTF